GARVVATAVGGLAEQIIHGVNGYLAAPDNPTALAEALRDAYAESQIAWAGERMTSNAQAQGLASADALRKVFDLLVGGVTEPDPTLVLEHGAWLAQQAARDGSTPLEAAQKLALALRHSDETSLAYDRRAFATTRQRRMDLNHAVAFFRGCGCRRIASANGEPAQPEVVQYCNTWGLEVVSAQDLPDGLWFEADTADIDLLQRRFPQARALVLSLPEGIETLDWTGDVTEE
ncbi:MAG: glycosyltransferase, partial [Terriglobales bacterium]